MANNVSSTNLTGLYGSTGNTVTVATSNVPVVNNSVASKNLTTLYSGSPTIIPSSGGNGGGANVAILDEGVLLTPSVTSMNFTGTSVTATNVGNAVTIDISGATSVTWANVTEKNGFSGPGSISIGQGAPNSPPYSAVFLGGFAGNSGSETRTVAIGESAGEGGQLANSVAIGFRAGRYSQGNDSVAVGYQAGQQSQNNKSIAIGANAGSNNQGNTYGYGIAIGDNAGQNNQIGFSVAIGNSAGKNNQSYAGIAIGKEAGSNIQGNYSIAIGSGAGYDSQGSNSIAIGQGAGFSAQGNNTIILNATGSILNQTTANTFNVKPVRNANTANVLYYDNTTGEITYDISVSPSNVANANYANFAGNVVNSAQPNITSLGNLPYLQISNSATPTGVIRQTSAGNIAFVSAGSNTNTYQITTIFHPNNSTNFPGDRFVRSRGNVTTPTTTLSGDRILSRVGYAYNGNTNAISVSEVFTVVGTVNANTSAQWTGGQWNMTTGNPSGDSANQASLTFQNALVYNNAGGISITPGTAPNTSLGQSTSQIFVQGYGSSTADLASTNTMFFQRARGNRDAVTSVLANDQLGQISWAAYNGTAYTGAKSGSFRVEVDSSYVANSLIVPIQMTFRTVDTANTSIFTTILANGGVKLQSQGNGPVLQGNDNGQLSFGVGAATTSQGNNAIAIGTIAGQLTQGANSVAVGYFAGYTGQGANSIALGAGAGQTNQANNTIILNATGSSLDFTTANSFVVKPVRNANTSNVMFYNDTTGEITYDVLASVTSSNISNGTSNVDIATSGGNITMGVGGNANIAVVTGNTVIVSNLTINSTVLALGNNAGFSGQGALSIAIGNGAANLNQGGNSIAIGFAAAANTQGGNSIAIGRTAGQNTQGGNAIAIGRSAGSSSQGTWGIALGLGAGQTSQSNGGIAIGRSAALTSQGANSVAIGVVSAYNLQGANSVAVGYLAGGDTQGSNSIAIGAGAGATNQANNNIILNATGSNLDFTTANSFVVKPVRNANTSNVLYYNNTTGEITYDVSSGGSGASISNGTSNVNIATVNGNITMGVGGNANIMTVTTSNVTITDLVLTSGNVVLGSGAGAGSTGGARVAIGANSGSGGGGGGSIAIGGFAMVGGSGDGAIAIGYNAGFSPMGNNAVALGYNSGTGGIGYNSIAIGGYAVAGYPSSNVVSIGANAGAGASSQANNSIVLNATGANLQTTTANTFTVKPIRSASTGNVLYYDNSSGEITYATVSAGTPASISNGTSNVSIAASGGNITMGVGGNANIIIVTSTSANVSNLALKQFEETVASSANTSTSISPNVAASTIFNYTANASFTFNGLTSAVAGSSATVIITQDATGSRTMTSTMLFVGGSKTLSTAANSKDIVSVFYDGTTYFASLTKGYA